MTFCRLAGCSLIHSVSCATFRRKSLHFTSLWHYYIIYGMYWCTCVLQHWIIQHLDCRQHCCCWALTAEDLKNGNIFQNIIGIQQWCSLPYPNSQKNSYVVFFVQGASFFAVYLQLHISIPITYIYLPQKTWIENVNGQWRRSKK